ncbi:unnamed protein product [Cylindrotheca closterium]|uniref:Methyltransferase type 11 domain-containing protein n=1 Tax=Cylindrotheca closterium TaxID=2856 RepID=A0AAD2CXJ4_9STRA|nr:unnamed protein product [Cylindrotheca closterium]
MTVTLAPITVPLLGLISIAMATPLRQTLFSMFIPRCMNKVDEEFSEERTKLLSTITGGSVLDVGSGGGAYFRYFSKADRVVAVEPQEIVYPKLNEAAKQNGLVDSSKDFSIVGDLKDVEGTFDHVVFGNVLCEVPNVDEALQQVDKLLAPGGRVYFSEHIGRPTGTWIRLFQDWYNPLHCHMTLGCNCNRDSLDKIRSMKNWDVVSWKYEHFQVCMGPFVMGLAVKKD